MVYQGTLIQLTGTHACMLKTGLHLIIIMFQSVTDQSNNIIMTVRITDCSIDLFLVDLCNIQLLTALSSPQNAIIIPNTYLLLPHYARVPSHRHSKLFLDRDSVPKCRKHYSSRTVWGHNDCSIRFTDCSIRVF